MCSSERRRNRESKQNYKRVGGNKIFPFRLAPHMFPKKQRAQKISVPVYLLLFLLLTCHGGDKSGLREKETDRQRERETNRESGSLLHCWALRPIISPSRLIYQI